MLSRPGPLPASAVAKVRATARAATETDGVAPLGEQALLDLADADVPVRHIVTDSGYAWLDLRGHPTTELVVAPDARRRGLGTALLAAVRSGAIAATGKTPLVWAHGDLPGARALAARAGLTVRRELWQLARDLGGALPPVPPTPPDVVVRAFVPGADEDAWLAVNARAFAHHPEQGRLTAADLAARTAEPWFRADDLLLAERDGRLLGFVWLKVEPGSDDGELYVLGVDPDAQRTGLGRLLTALTLRRFSDRALRRVLLYTEADNAAALRTYASAGFVRTRADVQYR